MVNIEKIIGWNGKKVIMKWSQHEKSVIEEILSDINLKNMEKTVEYFSHLKRYTGYQDAEDAVNYLTSQLKVYGVSYKRYVYEAYLGLPVHARVEVTSPHCFEVRALADVFSAEASMMEGELIFYDGEEENLDKLKGRIVLSRKGGEMARKVWEAGAIALFHISITGGDVIHHRGIGSVWGNPDLETIKNYVPIPSIGVSQNTGKYLISLMECGPVKVRCSVNLDRGVRKSTMPVAEIPGKTEKFVLISGHYDSWYEGITDNATSDAILLELARVFYRHRDDLIRGVKVAWWSGHSDGRYAGSSWYCDNEWEELKKNCVSHINLDLSGCKEAKQIRARTTLMEGMDFTADVIEKATGIRPETYLPMVRGADQSFWGTNIPIVIMAKYEPLPQERVSPCPGGGPWWHTREDTWDKMSLEYMMRDARLNGELAGLIAIRHCLPVFITGFLDEMRRYLDEIEKSLSKELEISPIIEKLEDLKGPVKRLEACLLEKGVEGDGIIKETAGELVRITYSYGSRYEHDEAREQQPFPGLRKAAGIQREEVSGEIYMAARTTFVRQRNRVVGQLEQVRRTIICQLERWEEAR